MLKRYAMAGFLLCLTVGCSQPKKPPKNEVFVTHITAKGLKQFQYSVIQSRQDAKKRKGQRPGGVSGSRKGKGGGQGRGVARKSEKPIDNNIPKRVHDRMRQLLIKRGYCREGFMEIDHYSEAGQIVFNGQCNEPATTADKVKFQNQE